MAVTTRKQRSDHECPVCLAGVALYFQNLMRVAQGGSDFTVKWVEEEVPQDVAEAKWRAEFGDPEKFGIAE